MESFMRITADDDDEAADGNQFNWILVSAGLKEYAYITQGRYVCPLST